MQISSLSTPAVLIDLDRVTRNIERYQRYCDAHKIRARPHIKTHKIPHFAHRQLAAGAVGITCQTLGEAEVMADAGIKDILISNNVLGRDKLARLRALHERQGLAVTADHGIIVEALSSAVEDAEPLTVLVECDTGGGRCGVQDPQGALALARTIDRSPGLRFGGIMTYPGRHQVERVQAWLDEARHLIENAGLELATISNGGTPDIWRAHEVPAAGEHRAGTYIYNDRMQAGFGACTLDDCALTVLTTVISRPTQDRAVIDAGSKILTSDKGGQEGHGFIPDYPEAQLSKLYEEHGILGLGPCEERPRLGERLRIIPNHACVVSNMVDRVHGHVGQDLVESFTVAARGRSA